MQLLTSTTDRRAVVSPLAPPTGAAALPATARPQAVGDGFPLVTRLFETTRAVRAFVSALAGVGPEALMQWRLRPEALQPELHFDLAEIEAELRYGQS